MESLHQILGRKERCYPRMDEEWVPWAVRLWGAGNVDRAEEQREVGRGGGGFQAPPPAAPGTGGTGLTMGRP